ncbi:MAG: transferase [Acidimicrobiales bacterium]|nr:MAG: transferase [Acidimicrobiales bacterium]
MSDRLVIVGAGGHGREALAIAREINRLTDNWHEIIFADDGPVDTDTLDRVEAEMIGGLAELRENGDDHVLAIGDPATRRRLDAEIDGDAPAISLVSLSAWIGEDVHLDDGVMIHPGATCTTNVRVGRHTHLNCGVIVSHDCRIGDYVSLSPGVLLNGSVTIEDDAFLGTGAIVLPGRRVGQGAIVGAGAVVVDDVAPGATVVGVPAR